jgi:hypothetical protein
MPLKDEEDVDKIAMKIYFEFCEQHKIVIQPQFVSFDYNTLYISQKFIDLTHGCAIGEFLYNARLSWSRRIFTLIIDECYMKDEVFAKLLEGCYRQCTFDANGKIKT